MQPIIYPTVPLDMASLWLNVALFSLVALWLETNAQRTATEKSFMAESLAKSANGGDASG